jgi:TRAP-type uncharacterized transport system substrate-binding protein
MNKKKLVKILGLWIAPIVGISALAIALFVFLYTPHQREHTLTMTAGQHKTTRHQVAVALQNAGTPLGIRIELRDTAGSEESLDRVNAGKLDAALVQGGLHVDDRPNVRQVATLNIEPLHLLVKKELLETASKNLAALEGKTVNIGTVGSGTYSLAKEALAFAGLHPQKPGTKGGYVATTLSNAELLSEQDRSKLPDAVVLVSCLPSEMTKHLVSERDYRLVPLPFGEAFSLDGLRADAGHAPSTNGDRVVRRRVQAVVIPAFTYHVEPPVPAAALPTLGTRLLLVAHKDVDAGAVQRLVDAVYSTEFATVSRPPLDAKLLDIPPNSRGITARASTWSETHLSCPAWSWIPPTRALQSSPPPPRACLFCGNGFVSAVSSCVIGASSSTSKRSPISKKPLPASSASRSAAWHTCTSFAKN